MNTATIRRNNGRGTRGGLGGRNKRPSQRKAWTAKLLEALPLDEHQLHRLITWALGLILLALLWLVALFFGIPAMLWSEASDLAGRAGMRVAKVEVHGTEHMEETPVYNQALTQVDHSMLSLDLEGVRAQIMKLGWVQDARISRRLPDTLVVNIVERRPVAVWQRNGEFSLVDASGVVLAGVNPSSMPGLPLVVGPDANRQTAALAKLMDAAPALKPMLAGATWIGNRRWDLQFQSGETLALPEGEAESAAALVNFARMDGVDRLLGRGFVRFDMRDPARFVARLAPGRSGGDVGAVPAAAQGTGALQPIETEDAAPDGASTGAKTAQTASKDKQG
ncbi:MAG: cell division protein FtsQ/DivIB [Sphingobium sp.]|nr:cell division protein FtsQ/DivIB [Sphingobium sp.]